MQIDIQHRIITGAAVILFLFLGAVLTASELHQEDGILTNHSAEYVRTLNRNTSTDADAAFYNPAGLAFMQNNGLHISFSTQTYYVKKTHTLDFYALQKIDSEPIPIAPPHKKPWFKDCLAKEYPAALTAPSLPGFDIVWKQNNWAAFFDIAVMQAATDMTYEDGLAIMDWGNLLAHETSMASTTHLIQYTRNARAIRNETYVGLTIGGAYQFINWLSAGGGLRLIHAKGNMKIEMNNINFIENDGTDPATSGDRPIYIDDLDDSWDIDTDTSGYGFGIIMSTHFKPEGLVSFLKGLEASFRAEYYPPMKLEKKTNKLVAPTSIEKSGNFDIFKDGSANPEMTYSNGNGSKFLKVTYPTSLNFGLSYLIFDRFKFLSSAQITLRNKRDLDGREKDYNMGYQAGGGIEFLLNQKVTLSTGYLYNDFGIKPNKQTDADHLLDSHQFGGGASFHVDENLDVNIGAFYQLFKPVTVYREEYINVSEPTISYLKKDYDETRFSFAAGVTYRLFGEQNRSDRSKKESETSSDTGKSKIKNQ